MEDEYSFGELWEFQTFSFFRNLMFSMKSLWLQSLSEWTGSSKSISQAQSTEGNDRRASGCFQVCLCLFWPATVRPTVKLQETEGQKSISYMNQLYSDSWLSYFTGIWYVFLLCVGFPQSWTSRWIPAAHKEVQHRGSAQFSVKVLLLLWWALCLDRKDLSEEGTEVTRTEFFTLFRNTGNGAGGQVHDDRQSFSACDCPIVTVIIFSMLDQFSSRPRNSSSSCPIQKTMKCITKWGDLFLLWSCYELIIQSTLFLNWLCSPEHPQARLKPIWRVGSEEGSISRYRMVNVYHKAFINRWCSWRKCS